MPRSLTGSRTVPARPNDVPEEALVSTADLGAPKAPIGLVDLSSGATGEAPEGSGSCSEEERSRPGRQARPEGSALTAPRVELSPATMEVDRRQAVMVAHWVVGHSGPHRCSKNRAGHPFGFGCADIPSFRSNAGPVLERERSVGVGGAWCVSGHGQVGSNSCIGRARRSGGLTSFAELAPWLCPNPHVASASTRISPSRRP